MQFVSVAMLGSGSVLMAAVTALMVAARHIFFSISMIGRYRSEGRKKWYLYYALCDETYAMLSRDEMPAGVNISAYRFLVTFFDQSAWVLGSVLGVAATLVCRILFGRVVPYTAMGLLIVYCLRDVSVLDEPHAIPEMLSMAVVCLTYLWKRNSIFSVVAGTALYMALVQMVF